MQKSHGKLDEERWVMVENKKKSEIPSIQKLPIDDGRIDCAILQFPLLLYVARPLC